MLWKVASFLGLPTFQFWSLAVCKNGGGRGRSGLFYHVNDVSIYLGRWGGVPDQKSIFRVRVIRFEPGTVHFLLANVQNSSTWERNYKKRPQHRSFNRHPPPPPPSVYLGRHWRHSCEKMDQAFPLHFIMYTTSNQKLDSGKAWEQG